ncbi:MAG: hypothetical protein IJC26_01070 [Clostridia bacterium]|nr:hypothetical protein [Clostridia bacterium]
MKNPFLDPGDGSAILKQKIVMILNAESATLQKDTRNFIRRLGSGGDSVLPKRSLRQVNSFILTNAYGKDSLYSSSRLSKSLAEEK